MLHFSHIENLPHTRMLPSVICMVVACGFMLALQISRANDLDNARSGVPAITHLLEQGYSNIQFEKVPSIQCPIRMTGHDFSITDPNGKMTLGTFCTYSNGVGQSIQLR